MFESTITFFNRARAAIQNMFVFDFQDQTCSKGTLRAQYNSLGISLPDFAAISLFICAGYLFISLLLYNILSCVTRNVSRLDTYMSSCVGRSAAFWFVGFLYPPPPLTPTPVMEVFCDIA